MPFQLPKLVPENLREDELDTIRVLFDNELKLFSAFPIISHYNNKDVLFRKRKYIYFLLLLSLYNDNRFKTPYVSEKDWLSNPFVLDDNYLAIEDNNYSIALVEKVVCECLCGGFDETIPEYYQQVICGAAE